MAKFKAFKPQAMERIARSMGYTGDMSGFRQYLDSNVSLKNRMKQLEDSATEMSKNGSVRVAQQTQEQAPDTVGGFVPPPTQTFNQEPVQMQQGGMSSGLKGDTLGYIINQNLNDEGMYVSTDTSYMTGFNGFEVQTINCCSYSNSYGEVNTMIGLVQQMIGDTMIVNYSFMNRTESIGIVLD